MKLQVKLAFYNAVSKALIIGAIGIFLPVLVQRVVYDHIDKRLQARLEKTMRMVKVGGLDEIALDQDCSFQSINIFQEEYVSITPLPQLPSDFGASHVSNTEMMIENQPVKHRVLSHAFIYDNQLYEVQIGEGLSAVDQLKISIRKFSLWLLIAVVLLSIFLDFAFAQVLLRPFNLIVNKKLKDVQHPASFDPKPIRTSTFEFAHLDHSINEMMQKIRETFQVEREFITNVSHELLTPVSILQNRMENILNDPSISEPVAERIVESQKTLSRLTKVVKALLYISKIENKQFERKEAADIQQVSRDVIEELEERISEKGITVINEWKANYVLQNSNLSLIHTMLFNLMSNAIKYNIRNGKIFLSGEKTDNGFRLRISDTGVGISAEQLPYIFDRFKRFRPDDEMSYGLGLPIVSTIANYHGIRLEVTSEPGRGSAFNLYFPAQPESAGLVWNLLD